ncbi:alpha/beta hydrolase fold domain-containing protein [Amnibacterium endophyticum]|uniref:Alpha/beta hydrolase fold domain-containing protein n=1 Tax=Amnibacterium endophyticum TaxID=2109337 RepID=A0ABW4LBQ1_9MICO
MSLEHDVVRAYITLSGRGRPWRSTEAFERALARRPAWPARPPAALPGVSIAQRDEPEGRVVRLTPRAATGSVVALHGGGYVFGPEPQHWTLWRRIAVASRREVVVPLYRLAPEGTAAVAVPWVAGLVRRSAGPVALLGDSAGGGLALAAALVLREEGLRPPLLLSAPWLDATMRRPWRLQRDPWLARPGFEVAADRWRGDLPVDHPFVSPLLADLGGIGPVVVASGTRDLLHEDARRVRQRAPGPVRLLVGEGLIHNYPLLPVPEARPAVRAFVDALR